MDRSKSLYRSVFEHSMEAVLFSSPDGFMYAANPAACNLFGYGEESLCKLSRDDLVDTSLCQRQLDDFLSERARTGRARAELIFIRKDGTRFPAEVSSEQFIDEKQQIRTILTIRDLTERKQAERMLAESEEQYRLLIAAMEEGVVLQDENSKILAFNKSAERILGLTSDQLIGKSSFDPDWYSIHEDGSPFPGETHPVVMTLRTGLPQSNVIMGLHKPDGRLTWISINVVPIFKDGEANPCRVVATMRDITEQKRVEDALRASEVQLNSALRIGRMGHWEYNVASDRFLFNDNFYAIFHTTAAEVGGYEMSAADYAKRFVYPDDAHQVAEEVRAAVESKDPAYSRELEHRILYADGQTGYIIVRFTVIKDADGRTIRTFGVNQDITERKRNEEALRESRNLLATVVDNVPIRVFWKDTTLRYMGCNSLFAHDAGMTEPKDLLGKNDYQMGWKDQAESYRADDKLVMDSGTPKIGIEEPQSTPDGLTIWRRTSKVPLRGQDGKTFGVLGVYDDITDQKLAEVELRRNNWALRALSRSNSALVHARTEHELFQECCDAITSSGQYALAWIGEAKDDVNKSVEILAAAGKVLRYIDGFEVSWGEGATGMGPTGVAIRTGISQVFNDAIANPLFGPWRDRAKGAGLASTIAVPIRIEGKTFGVLAVYSRESTAFMEDELKLFEEMASDIGYGTGSRRTRAAYDAGLEERTKHATKLRSALENTITSLAAVVEKRDPYTAGHQRRVARLAVAIGRELGLSEDCLDGIGFASTIHDIGKINIPAEILSRPGRLSSFEFELVQGHAQAGYDIVKGVDFPWPVAQTIWQHHERLDGGGYPQGLKGEEIILEARVLAVADIVEAMSSHRPYRPGLGVDAALAEIEKGAGTLYDPRVVSACLKLFREKEYRIPD